MGAPLALKKISVGDVDNNEISNSQILVKGSDGQIHDSSNANNVGI